MARLAPRLGGLSGLAAPGVGDSVTASRTMLGQKGASLTLTNSK